MRAATAEPQASGHARSGASCVCRRPLATTFSSAGAIRSTRLLILALCWRKLQDPRKNNNGAEPKPAPSQSFYFKNSSFEGVIVPHCENFSIILFSLLRIAGARGLDRIFHRQSYEDYFLRQRTPSFVCSITIPLARSSARMASDSAKFRACRAAAIWAIF